MCPVPENIVNREWIWTSKITGTPNATVSGVETKNKRVPQMTSRIKNSNFDGRTLIFDTVMECLLEVLYPLVCFLLPRG
jgi:hypothetical protein